jgi:hypothetical protein
MPRVLYLLGLCNLVIGTGAFVISGILMARFRPRLAADRPGDPDSSLVCLALLAKLLPRDIRAPGASFDDLGRLLSLPAARWILTLTLLYFSAVFMVASYLGPVLQALVPMSTAQRSFTLMLFAIAGATGTMVGGWANDRYGATRTLSLQLGMLASPWPCCRSPPVTTAGCSEPTSSGASPASA